ncbi:MAG: rod shape-determining protein MreD [Negativicutes bacterium]|jgi:rod shape-determining protein MreD
MRSLFWIGLGLLVGVFDYTFAHHLTSFGLAPSLLFLTVVLAALLEDRKTSLIVGLVLGLVADVMTASAFGVKTVTFTIIAIIVVVLRRNTISYSIFLQIAAVVVATVITAIGTIFFIDYYGGNMNFSDCLLRWYLPFMVINALVMPFFAFFIKKLHCKYIKYFD